MSEPAPLFPVSRVHLDELSDAVGIMQHAIGPRPDPAHGYCTDDVARALIVDLLHGAELGWPAIARSVDRSMAFLEAAFDPETGRFRNFRDVAGRWLEAVGSEDSHARAVLALGETSAAADDPRVRAAAASLFERALPATLRLTYLRPLAAAVVATEVAARGGSRAATKALPRLAAAVWLLTEHAQGGQNADWPWPEPVLTYENGLVARALIVAGDRLGEAALLERGLQLLDWLVSVQTAPNGHFSPIGNDGWWPHGGSKARYDQQPMEATALLLAAEAAFEATGDARHRATMEWTYGWFLGRNDGGRTVAVPKTGGGQDGLKPSGVNPNQGAESTLMWLIALERIRAARRSPAGTTNGRLARGAGIREATPA
ncbi:MAG: hypothetical protein ABI628_02540 [Chloroflexota bacterium]